MTRTPHDQFAKQYLEELLSLLGQVETSRDVASEVRSIDVNFVPAKPPPTNPQILGVLLLTSSKRSNMIKAFQ
jgi:hypothetical protein